MASFAFCAPTARVNALRLPRRDFVVAAGDDLRLRVTFVDGDGAAQSGDVTRLTLRHEDGQAGQDYGWSRRGETHTYDGAMADDGAVLLRVPGAATVDMAGRWRLSLLTRLGAVLEGVLSVLPSAGAALPAPAIFVLGTSLLGSTDEMPAAIVNGVPVDAEGFPYV